jgi:TetR/AcrR family transcriptional regulator, transcriptional repressor for nem operon
MTLVMYPVKGRAEESEGQMRVSREKAAENRERIVEAASRMFRKDGFDGAGIDTIMNAAGLTHGGFYGHFGSKDELAAEAVTRALERGVEKQSHYTTLSDLVSGYLSERHCADRANGCAVAALGGDMARQGEGVRRGLTAHVRSQLDRFAHLLRNGTMASRRKRAIARLAGMVGALTLARAVDDPALSKEILAAAREAFGGARSASPGSARHDRKSGLPSKP